MDEFKYDWDTFEAPNYRKIFDENFAISSLLL